MDKEVKKLLPLEYFGVEIFNPNPNKKMRSQV